MPDFIQVEEAVDIVVDWLTDLAETGGVSSPQIKSTEAAKYQQSPKVYHSQMTDIILRKEILAQRYASLEFQMSRVTSFLQTLTDEELQLWNTKHEASGLSKTDYLMQAIRNSEVRVYSIEESIAPIVHEIRKIGTNLNQLAYFSNIGQEYRVRSEIEAIRKTNDRVMGQLSDFLNDPKFHIKGSK